MGRKKKIISKEECMRFNSLRTLFGERTFTRSEVCNLIRSEVGWGKNTIDKVLQEILIKPTRGTYCFPKNPIYIDRLKTLMTSIYIERHNKYMESKEDLSKDVQILKAINFLKENGYTVCKLVKIC